MSAIATDLPACNSTLSADQLAAFRAQGYIAFRDILSPDEVATARAHIRDLVAAAAADTDAYTLGGSTLSHAATGFHVQFEPAVGDSIRRDDPGLELKVRKLMRYTRVDSFFSELAHSHAHIRGVLAAALGPDSEMFQDMALVKPPRIGRAKPWHQDNAYFTVTPLDAVIGVWIALDDATVENGCMHVLPGGHLRGPICHYHGSDCELRPDRIQWEGHPVEVPAGGGLFFFGMLPHMTPPNTSDLRRRALQLHYRSKDSVSLPRDEYDALFAEADGTPASCAANK